MIHTKYVNLMAVLVCFLSVAMSSHAQANIAEADSILTRILFLRTDVRELSVQLPGLSGEDSLIIQHELDYARFTALDQVFLLIELLAEVRDERSIRPEEQAVLDLVSPSFTRVESRITSKLKEIRSQRKGGQIKQLLVYEENLSDAMTQLDKVQNLIFRFTKAMEKLEQPTPELDTYLHSNIKDRARILVGRLRISMKDQAALIQRLPSPATGEDALLLQAAKIRIDSNVNSLRSLISLMKEMEIDTTTYEAYLIQSTGKLTSSDLSSGALMRFLNNWIQEAIEFLKGNGMSLGFRILSAVAILVAFHYLGIFLSKIVIASIDASKFRPSQLLRNMIRAMTARITMLIGILVVLSQMGISLGPMLAGLGVAGFIVGFALQDTLANFASGIMILFYRPFDVGDMVETGTVFGQVKQMSLVSTIILTIDNQTLVVPNNMIWGDVIKNVTAQNVRRVDMKFGVSYADNIPKVEKIFHEILEEHKMVLKKPAPMIKLHELGDSSVNFVVRPWVRTDDYWDVHWDVTREVKMRFDAEGVTIPFPQQDVHLFDDKAEG